MKKLAMITMSVAVLASTSVFSNAFAQEKTRAEVRQELIQAENDGSRFVTDTSYPEVNPIFVQQVAQLKQQNNSGVGPGMSGSSASGQRMPDESQGFRRSMRGPGRLLHPVLWQLRLSAAHSSIVRPFQPRQIKETYIMKTLICLSLAVSALASPALSFAQSTSAAGHARPGVRRPRASRASGL